MKSIKSFTEGVVLYICLCSGLPCKVSAGNDVACLTTNHLAALAELEPRLVPLVLAFRYWAKVRSLSFIHSFHMHTSQILEHL